MSQPTSKPHYGPVVKVAVLAIMLLQYMQTLTTPAAGAILNHFKQFGYTSLDIKQIQTIPTLVMIFATMAIIPMARVMRKKTILKIAMVLIFVGGIAPGVGPANMMFIYACRVVFGCGYGMVFSLASSFVVDLFDGDEQKKMMGWRTAAGAVGGVIFQTIGGILAAMYWKYAFLGFLIALPFIIFIWIKCPDPTDLEQAAAGASEAKPKAPLNGGHWFVIILAAVNVAIYSSFMTNMPIVIMAQKLGNPNTVALVMNFFTLGIFLGAFTYGWNTRVMKRYDVPICCLLFGVILILLTRFVSLPTYIAFTLVYGLAFGTMSPSLILAVSRQGSPLAATSAIALFVAGQGLGQFAQPYVLLLTGPLGLNSWGELAPWVLAGPVMVVIAIASFIWTTMVTNKKFPYGSENKIAAK